jgi:hypothetical protein
MILHLESGLDHCNLLGGGDRNDARLTVMPNPLPASDAISIDYTMILAMSGPLHQLPVAKVDVVTISPRESRIFPQSVTNH